MSKTPTAVYACHRPERLDAYLAEIDVLWEAYRAKIKELEDELGTETLLCRGSKRGQFISGYVAKDRNEAPLPGFRREQHSDHMVPALRTKAGKALAERLNAVSYDPPQKPGLPDLILGEGYMGGMSIKKIGGVWYAWTTVPLGDRDPRNTGLGEVDPAMWTPAKLSDYFLAVEAEEATSPDSA